MAKTKLGDKFGFVFSTDPDFQYTPDEEEQTNDLDNEKQPLKIWLDKKKEERKRSHFNYRL